MNESNEWTNDQINEIKRMNERKDDRMNGQTNELVNEWMNEWTWMDMINGWMDERLIKQEWKLKTREKKNEINEINLKCRLRWLGHWYYDVVKLKKNSWTLNRRAPGGNCADEICKCSCA